MDVGAAYAHLGAAITGPQAGLNLGIITLSDGATSTEAVLDTSAPGSHIIEYRAFNQNGTMGTAQRTFIAAAPANDNPATTTVSAATSTH